MDNQEKGPPLELWVRHPVENRGRGQKIIEIVDKRGIYEPYSVAEEGWFNPWFDGWFGPTEDNV